jgi:hypothetical protein
MNKKLYTTIFFILTLLMLAPFAVVSLLAQNCEWAKSAGGIYYEGGNSVATDANGNIYMTGYFQSPTITFGSTTLTNPSVVGGAVFIVKYDAAGNLLWAKAAGNTAGSATGMSVSIDASSNVYITGRFDNPSITFGSITITNGSTISDDEIFIAKFDSSGNVLWAKSAGGSDDDFGQSISTDASGNAYITGSFSSPSITFGTTILTTSINGGIIFFVKYATDGSVLWATSEGGNTSGSGQGVSADASGNVYITGRFLNLNIMMGTNIITNAGGDDIFIAKYAGMLTGVENGFGKKEFNISPNPTSSTFTLTIPQPINNNITITDLTGKQVASYNLQNTTTKTIEVSHLAEGVYFVTLNSDEGVVTKKLVKRN